MTRCRFLLTLAKLIRDRVIGLGWNLFPCHSTRFLPSRRSLKISCISFFSSSTWPMYGPTLRPTWSLDTSDLSLWLLSDCISSRAFSWLSDVSLELDSSLEVALLPERSNTVWLLFLTSNPSSTLAENPQPEPPHYSWMKIRCYFFFRLFLGLRIFGSRRGVGSAFPRSVTGSVGFSGWFSVAIGATAQSVPDV